MQNTISRQARAEVLMALRERYQQAPKQEKTKVLDEFIAVAGCHRKHAIRLLTSTNEAVPAVASGGRRTYDEAVREALIVLWKPRIESVGSVSSAIGSAEPGHRAGAVWSAEWPSTPRWCATPALGKCGDHRSATTGRRPQQLLATQEAKGIYQAEPASADPDLCGLEGTGR